MVAVTGTGTSSNSLNCFAGECGIANSVPYAWASEQAPRASFG